MPLYICPTPIGNLEDITLRVLRVLKEADVIACEDTRTSAKLLSYYDIPVARIHYDDHHKTKGLEKILRLLEEGKSVALITDAGTPLVSDPGYVLIKEVLEKGYEVISLPGASAFVTALAGSGLETDEFTFLGFLPRKVSEKRKKLKDVLTYRQTLIFYESPRRLVTTLKDMIAVLGNRKAVVARELTKIYEEYVRGSLEDILDTFQEREPQGEIVILVEGFHGEQEFFTTVEEDLLEYIKQGFSKKDAVDIVSKERGIPKREIYAKSIDL